MVQLHGAVIGALCHLGEMIMVKANVNTASREELIEVLMQTACYAGVPAAVAALNAGADVLK